MKNISLFKKPVSNIEPNKTVSISDVYDYIISDEAKKITEQYHLIEDHKEAAAFESTQFDFVTFSGEFGIHTKGDLKQYSGLIFVHVYADGDPEEAKDALLNIPHLPPTLMFNCPCGCGVRAVYSHKGTVETQYDSHEYISQELERLTGLEADYSSDIITTGCTLTWDSEAYYNDHIPEVKIPPKDLGFLIDLDQIRVIKLLDDDDKWAQLREAWEMSHDYFSSDEIAEIVGIPQNDVLIFLNLLQNLRRAKTLQ